MNSNMFREIELAKASVNWRVLKIVSAALALIGAAVFLYGAFSGSQRAWQAFLTNFVFWSGLSFGAFLLSPMLVITNAHWGRALKRLAEAAGAFIPVSFVLFWILLAGREAVFPWITHPPHAEAKLIWLNVPFLFIRNGIGLLALAVCYVLITHNSVQADLEHESGGRRSTWSFYRVQSYASTVYAILYAFILTLISFDLIMSLNPEWISTLFGAYYFAGSFYSGIAVIILLAVFAVKKLGLGEYITTKQFHDLGKLLFAFCIVCADFFYVQFLVIWYGNMPEETRYVITRVGTDQWAALAWTVLFLCYVLPFLILLFRKIKMTLRLIAAMSVWVLAAMWLERFFLVAPSIWKDPSMPLGFMELMVSIGFLGIYGSCTVWFLEKYPLMPVSDPLFAKLLEERTHELGTAAGVAGE